MTIHSNPVPVEILPENAPFNAEQRAWLNGFFAGILSPGTAATGATALDGDEAARLTGGAAEDDGAPWHDPSMELPERMTLAEGKPLKRRMYAAMAQQDCGQCGYVCETYSAALVEGKEKRLNLCAPGGKDTLRMLNTLAVELDGAPAPASAEPAAPAIVSTDAGPSRDNPAQVSFLSRRRLNKGASEKQTYHIEFDLAGSGLTYVPGDSFGIYPRNDPRLADAIVALLGARPDASIGGKSLRDKLIEDCALGPAPDGLFQLFSYMSGGETRRKAQALAAGEDPDGDLDRLDILGSLHKFTGLRPGAEAFVEALDVLQPRLYSISSSPRANPDLLTLPAAVPARGGCAGRPHPGLRPERDGLRLARRSQHTDHHGRSWYGRGAVPLLPAGARRQQCAWAQLAILRPSAARQRFLLRRRIRRLARQRQVAAPHAGLVARRE